MATSGAAYQQSGDHAQQEGEKYSLERTSISSNAPLNKDDVDVEAQMATPAQPPPAQPLEYSISTTKKLVFLGLYFFLSLGLTLSNKALMKTVSSWNQYLIRMQSLTHVQVKLPWLLTVLHTGSTFIGCCMLLASGQLKLSRLGTKENLVLVAFSTLFTLNIAISNVSLSVSQNRKITITVANMIAVRLYLYHSTKFYDRPALSQLSLFTALPMDDHTLATHTSR
jgi:hypothetical protein